jgi:2-hydroxychromene-2-carboxylate isomerase
VPREQPVFYYDLGSPPCYLAAEQLRGEAIWEPVMGSELQGNGDDPDRAAIERRAHELGLQPIRWPERWPPDSHRAMLAATYAKRIGRGVAFSLAAFRQAFAGGADLGSDETIMLAGAASELHPSALLKGIGLRATAQALASATERARHQGVRKLPAVVR